MPFGNLFKKKEEELVVKETAEDIDRKERLLNPGMYGEEEELPELNGSPTGRKRDIPAAFLEDLSDGASSACNTPRKKKGDAREATASSFDPSGESETIESETPAPPSQHTAAVDNPPAAAAPTPPRKRQSTGNDNGSIFAPVPPRKKGLSRAVPALVPPSQVPTQHQTYAVPKGFDPKTGRQLSPTSRQVVRRTFDRPHGTNIPSTPLTIGNSSIGGSFPRPGARRAPTNRPFSPRTPMMATPTDFGTQKSAFPVSLSAAQLSDDPPQEEQLVEPEPAAAAASEPKPKTMKWKLHNALDKPRTTKNFETTGSCRSLSKRELGILACIVLTGLIVVLVLAPWAADDVDVEDFRTERDLKNSMPRDPRDVQALFRWGDTGLQIVTNPPTISVKDFRERGLKITVAVRAGVPFDARTPRPSAREKLDFTSDVDPEDSPSAFSARLAQIYGMSRVTVREQSIDIDIPKGNGIHGHVREVVSLFVKDEGGQGFPIKFTLTEEELRLPNEEKAVDTSSKAAAAGYALTAIGGGGVGQGIGSLPRLSMIAAAFNCPSDEYFEMEWVEHPMSLVGFESVSWGDFEPLAVHVATMIGAYIIMLGATVILLFLIFIHRLITARSWPESAACIGFPNYLTPFLVFLSPGISISTTTCAVHHPDAGVKIFAILTFILLIGLPIYYYFRAMKSRAFKEGMQYSERAEDDVMMKYWVTKFLFGEFEWEPNNGDWDGRIFNGCHAMYYQDYRHHATLYLLLEFLVTVAMGMAEALKPPDEAGCRWKSWFILFTNTVHFGSLWFMEPLIVRYQALYAVILSGVLEAILVCVVINQNNGGGDREGHWTTMAAGELANIEVWLIKLKVFFDLAFAILETALTGECNTLGEGRKLFKPKLVAHDAEIGEDGKLVKKKRQDDGNDRADDAAEIEPVDDVAHVVDVDIDRQTENGSFYPLADGALQPSFVQSPMSEAAPSESQTSSYLTSDRTQDPRRFRRFRNPR